MTSTNFPRAGQRVRVIKQSACVDAVIHPGSWNDWVPGACNNQGSLPVDYELEGILFAPVELGQHLCVLRQVRNGVRVDGTFISTKIMALDAPDKVITVNSVYFISAL